MMVSDNAEMPSDQGVWKGNDCMNDDSQLKVTAIQWYYMEISWTLRRLCDIMT